MSVEQRIQLASANWLTQNVEAFDVWLKAKGIKRKDTDLQQLIILAFRYDPVFFCETVFPIQLEQWQKDFMYAVRDNDRISVRSGTGVGKSCAVALLTIWFVFTHSEGVLVACISASEANLKSGIWKEVQSWHSKMPMIFRKMLTCQQESLFQTDQQAGCKAEVRTANKDRPETIQGLHSENMIVICDEASGIDEPVYDGLSGAMATDNAKMIMISNPTRTSGYFYDSHRHPERSKLWVKIHIPATPEFSKRINQKWVDDMILQYGSTEDPQYKMRVLGDFPDMEEMVVIPRGLIEKSFNQSIDITPGPIYWGLDVARSLDRDRTVLVKRQANAILEAPQFWRSNDLMQTVGAIVNEYHTAKPSDRPARIFVDSIGLGGGVVDRLREQGLPVTGINVSVTPFVKARFMRRRDELWWSAREWFEARNRRFVINPENAAKDQAIFNQLMGELCFPKYKFESTGKIKVESKDEIRSRVQYSPDMADALILTLSGSDQINRTEHEVDTSYVV